MCVCVCLDWHTHTSARTTDGPRSNNNERTVGFLNVQKEGGAINGSSSSRCRPPPRRRRRSSATATTAKQEGQSRENAPKKLSKSWRPLIGHPELPRYSPNRGQRRHTHTADMAS